jgi:hypothetical protein
LVDGDDQTMVFSYYSVPWSKCWLNLSEIRILGHQQDPSATSARVRREPPACRNDDVEASELVTQ